MDKYFSQKSVNGIAKALVIGYRQDLDPEVYQQYVNMGVVHVIAISGLHVGIISYIIGLVLFTLYKHKKSKLIALCIHLFILFGFCFLAGKSPSILRACLCFSILAIGQHLFHPIRNPFQSLALSAFIILCIDPMCLFQLGFIFSYGALVGLFLIAKYIKNWIYPKSWFYKKVTEIFSATLAAQIFVLPISLYLFHQFSIYFILSNLLIIPLSSVVLIGIIILLSLSWIPIIPIFISWIVTIGIQAMNFIINQTSKLPYSLFTDIPITGIQTILLYIIALLLVLWIQQQKRKFGLYIASIFFVYFTIQLIENIHHNKQNTLIVLNTPKQTNLALINGSNTIIYTSSTDTLKLYKQYIQNLSYYYWIKNIQYHFLDTENTTIYLHTKKFYILNNNFIDTFSTNAQYYFIFSNTYHKIYNLKQDTLSHYIVSQYQN
ncbi:MAG: ComEC/Rec2 family competence protein [Chitinophagaceae bacterium]